MTLELHVLAWTANISGLNWIIEFQPSLLVCMYAQFGYEAAGRDTGTTILVHNTGNTSILPVSSSICNTGTDTGKY